MKCHLAFNKLCHGSRKQLKLKLQLIIIIFNKLSGQQIIKHASISTIFISLYLFKACYYFKFHIFT